ncbi:ADP-ribosylglycohydrolase family protein [Sphaerisporangium viridialbum]|uniref:ADP-ribosylglycohydrolase family protein n=1 Tax=Sphaerisporangium viridialbum TaxID=46189 RepID=UPI003C758F35
MHEAEHSDVTFGSRVRGCLLGGAIGDALGAPIEFDSIAHIRHHHGRAGLTDLTPDWRGRPGHHHRTRRRLHDRVHRTPRFLRQIPRILSSRPIAATGHAVQDRPLWPGGH